MTDLISENPFKDEFKDAKDKSEKEETKELKGEFKDTKDKFEHEGKAPEKPAELKQADPETGRFATEPLAGELGRDALLAHADALENAARVLRHFIAQHERPDLTRGALRNEPGSQDG